MSKHLLKFIILPALLAASFFLLLWSCAGSKSDYYRPDVPECDITVPLDSFFNSVFPNPEEPGCIVAVMKNDSIIYCNGFGLADLSTGERMTDTTLVNIASASKSITTGALLQLAEKGMVNLDSSLYCYFPELDTDFFRKITLRNVLSHSSGLPDLRPRNHEEWAKYLKSHTSVFASGRDYRLYGTEKEHFHIFENMTSTEYEPGTAYTRNEPAYILLPMLIERVTGVPFERWITDKLFTPAKMKHVFYITPGQDFPKCAHGYRPSENDESIKSFHSKDGKWEEYDYGEVPFFISKADFGAYTTIRDFMAWKRAYYKDGIIVSNEKFMEMFRPMIDTEVESKKYGLGCTLTVVPGSPIREYKCSANGGFCVVESSWPTCSLHYAVFSNRSDMPLFHVLNGVDSILTANGYVCEQLKPVAPE